MFVAISRDFDYPVRGAHHEEISFHMSRNGTAASVLLVRRCLSARGIDLIHIQPGKPTRNAFVERFNRTIRHEWLELVNFESVQQAQFLATQWLWTYNNEQPNSAIGEVPPKMLNPVV